MSSYAIKIDALGELDDEHFAQLCRDNPELKFERNATGELIVMAPTGGETGRVNIHLAAELFNWNQRAGLGECFDSSTGFKLPNGAERSPDLAWVEKSRWLTLTPKQREAFPPIAPDFVLELRSPSDNLATLQAKMREYMANGVRLGWLIDRPNQQVEIYRPEYHSKGAVEVLNLPVTLDGEAVLPGFTLALDLMQLANHGRSY